MMVSLVSPSLSCNTNKLSPKRIRNRSRSWCFTLNNHTVENWSQLSHPDFLICGIKKIMIQEELGENGTPHIQGFLMFKQQVDFSKVKALIPKAHIEKSRNPAASIKYCSKQDTRSGLRYSFGIKESEKEGIKIPDMTQEEICDDMKKQLYDDIDSGLYDLDIDFF